MNKATNKSKVMLNLIQHLQRELLSFKNGVRGRSRIKYGMTSLFNNSKAFTLIELLVVVLIIGILAAVALPQYRLAIGKTRSAEIMIMVRNVKEAQERYWLANNEYTTLMENLDLDLPSVNGSYSTLPNGAKMWINAVYVAAENSSRTNTFMAYYMNTNSSRKGLRMCLAKQNDTVANRICKSLGGSFFLDDTNCSIGPCTWYRLP